MKLQQQQVRRPSSNHHHVALLASSSKRGRRKAYRYFANHGSLFLVITVALVIIYSMTLFLGTISFLDRPENLLESNMVHERGRHKRVLPYEERRPIDHDAFDFDYNQQPVVAASTLDDPQIFKEHSMLVIVLSARQNRKRRQTIRETWGKGHAVYFVIGGGALGANNINITANNKRSATGAENEELRQEQHDHRDLIDSVHPDSYRALPHKLQFALKWIVRNCPAAQWILKVDDDMYARVASVERILVPLFNPATPMVVGRILRHQAVQKSGKWAELSYPHPFYPPWPQGSCGYLISQAAAQLVTDGSNSLKYQGEDTSLGIWLAGAQNPSVHWIDSPFFVNNGDCQLPRLSASTNATSSLVFSKVPLVIGHRITPELMRRCYDTGNDEWNMTTERYFFLETHSQKMNRDNDQVATSSKDKYLDDEKKYIRANLDWEESNRINEARKNQKKERAAERAKHRQSLQQQQGKDRDNI